MSLMLQPALAGPDYACANHGRESQPSADIHRSSEHAMGRSGTHHDSPRVPCKTSGSVRCCEAVASCAVTLAVTTPDRAPVVADAASGVPVTADGTLLARAVGPEPPPPKS